MAFKLHNSDEIEGIEIKYSDYPQVFQTKCEEYAEENGVSIEQVRKDLKDATCYLELYYEKGASLFGVDSDAVTSLGDEIVSPYTSENAENCEDF